MEIVKKYKAQILVGVIVLLIVLILLVLDKENKIIIPNNSVDNTITEPIPNDMQLLEDAVNKVNTSEIETISNKNNEQADMILDVLGVDVKDLSSYAANIDLRLESAHVIVTLRPKEGKYDAVKLALMNYMVDKQNFFTSNGLEDSELYQIVLNSTLYQKGSYIFLVIEKNAESIVNSLIKEIFTGEEYNPTPVIVDVQDGEIEETEMPEELKEVSKETDETSSELAENTESNSETTVVN